MIHRARRLESNEWRWKTTSLSRLINRPIGVQWIGVLLIGLRDFALSSCLAAPFTSPTTLQPGRLSVMVAPSDSGLAHVVYAVAETDAIPEGSPVLFQRAHDGLLYRTREDTDCAEAVGSKLATPGGMQVASVVVGPETPPIKGCGRGLEPASGPGRLIRLPTRERLGALHAFNF